MSDEITPYDPNAIMKNVTDKIKATFAELIPNEKWEEMVQAQIDKFIKKQTMRYGETQPSEFERMCQDALKEVAREKIAEHVKAKYAQHFDTQGQAVDDALAELLKDNAAAMMAAVMRQQAQMMINQLQSNAGGYR